jgi:uncharacterized protein
VAVTGLELALAVAVGAAVGILSAALGVGGGLLMVPFMVLVLESSQHLAEGTSLAVMVVTTLAGVFLHARGELVDFRAAATIALPGVLGAILGARLALSLDAEILKTFFGLLVIAVGIDMMRRGFTARKTT